VTKVFGIIGDPIEQVRSPTVFNTLFREKNIDAVLVPLHVRPNQLAQVLEGLRGIENLSGVIITIPHKTMAANIAMKKSPRVTIANAANALRPCEGGWECDLFDGEGFARGMEVTGHQLQKKNCALVGCGGAGAAVALALLDRGVAQLSLWDTDRQKCKDLADRLRGIHKAEITISPPKEEDIVINATPLGMNPNDPFPFDLELLRADAIVADVIMKPPKTKLLIRAAELGLTTHEGRHMLDNQINSIWEFFRLPSQLPRQP
jgi:shikimate dehydrogenase